MKIIKASTHILNSPNGIEILKSIERAGRTCYKSEDLITEDSALKFVKNVIAKKHESVLEHQSISVLFINDRGVSHEQVRHRIAAYSQESTRFCSYNKGKFGGEITIIDIRDIMKLEIGKSYKDPITNEMIKITPERVDTWIGTWIMAMQCAESNYLRLTSNLCPAQLARSVLPNSLKTEIVITFNLRQWRRFFNMRAVGIAGTPHPQMLELTIPLLAEFKKLIPVVFDDININT